MAALVFKLGALAMKTVSKPLGNRFKTWIMNHPTHRETVLRLAQKFHRAEVNISRRADEKQGKAFIGAMTDEASVELASKIVSESFVFVVGTVLIFAEYERGRRKEVAKQRREEAEREAIMKRAQEERERLTVENQHQEEIIDALVSRVDKLEEVLETMQRAQASERTWSGFFAPLGLGR